MKRRQNNFSKLAMEAFAISIGAYAGTKFGPAYVEAQKLRQSRIDESLALMEKAKISRLPI